MKLSSLYQESREFISRIYFPIPDFDPLVINELQRVSSGWLIKINIRHLFCLLSKLFKSSNYFENDARKNEKDSKHFSCLAFKSLCFYEHFRDRRHNQKVFKVLSFVANLTLILIKKIK